MKNKKKLQSITNVQDKVATKGSDSKGMAGQQADRMAILGPKELSDHLILEASQLGFEAKHFVVAMNLDELKIFFESIKSQNYRWVHPGLSLWAARPEFVALAESHGIRAIAPSQKVLQIFSNKLSLFTLAESLGIQHLAYHLNPFTSVSELKYFIEQNKIELPVILKPTMNTSQWGVQMLTEHKQLDLEIPLWIKQLKKTSEASVLVERCLSSSRHVFFAFVRLSKEVIHFFPDADISLQSRSRRMIQFYPAQFLTDELRIKIQNICQLLAESSHLIGFAAFEFLVDGEEVYLIDGIARLNASFLVYEKILDQGILSWQLAALEPQFNLAQFNANVEKKSKWSYAVSARLYAEDPVRQIPTPGWIEEMTESKDWSRGDSTAQFFTARSNHSIVHYKDTGVLGEVFAYAESPKRAIDAAIKALEEVWIAGSIHTNQRYLIEHFEHPFVRENLIHAGFSDEEFIPSILPDPNRMSLMVTALRQGLGLKEENRFKVQHYWIEALKEDLKWLQEPRYFESNGRRGFIGVFEKNFKGHRFCAFPLADHKWKLSLGTWSMVVYEIQVSSSVVGSSAVTGSSAVAMGTVSKNRKIYALTDGCIQACLVREGDIVEAHEHIVLIESLSMLVPHASPIRLRLESWKVKEGQEVKAGEELAELSLLS